MNFNPLSLVLIAGGGWLLYNWLSTSTSAAAGSGQPAAHPITPAGTPKPPATDTVGLVRAASVKAGYPSGSLLNGDQWNYFYQAVRGIPGPDIPQIWPDRDRSFQMSIEEWWAGVSSKGGLSGIQYQPGFGRRAG